MPSPEFIARPPDGFSALAIARGLQLTVVGSYRALQNPELFKGKYYRQAAAAVAASLAIQWVLTVLIRFVLVLVGAVRYVISFGNNVPERGPDLATVSELVDLSGLLIGLVRYARPELDDMFMTSLAFIDRVYAAKHPAAATDRYYARLSRYEPNRLRPAAEPVERRTAAGFVHRYMRRTAWSLAAYMLADVPVIGRAVMPLTSLVTFRQRVGSVPALMVFVLGFVLSRRAMALFLAAFWGGRSIMGELLRPYFSRIPFSRAQRDDWHRAREGVLFGFGLGFYLLFKKVPYAGVLMYGFAEAAAAYLVTKITDPPPEPVEVGAWIDTQRTWTSRTAMLRGAIVDAHADGFSDLPGGRAKLPPPPLPPRQPASPPAGRPAQAPPLPPRDGPGTPTKKTE
ncbi:uncharacterized protein V1510DRAFT_322758 [Dipodascopsis tothii]|uniref:uncharacterized protein n=1 Tax=Dipodascopsis tothii TaxID=44089 RepID=UPI0034CE7402